MLISIITTSYNYGEFIEETISSVLAQTYSDWELIVVDDCSDDNSVEIIKKFTNDNRITLICHDKNKGLKASIQTGLKYAKGEWVAFLESDDSLAPDALEKRVTAIDSGASLIFNSVNLIGDKDWIEATEKQALQTHKTLENMSFPRRMFKDFEIKNLILTLSSVMLKKELLLGNLFNTKTDALFDWWLYINLSYKHDFYYLPENLTNWRLHEKSYIKTPKRKKFYPVNVIAYMNIFLNHPSVDLFFFVCLCGIKTLFVRLKVYYIGFIRKLKSLLGLKNKKSPLFD